jgi:hypothetical protein
MARSGCAFFRLWGYWDRICLDARCIVECLCDDVRALHRAVTVAAAVRAPFEREGGGAHGGVMVFVATVDTVFKDFKGASKTWSRYWPSPAFRYRSGDTWCCGCCCHAAVIVLHGCRGRHFCAACGIMVIIASRWCHRCCHCAMHAVVGAVVVPRWCHGRSCCAACGVAVAVVMLCVVLRMLLSCRGGVMIMVVVLCGCRSWHFCAAWVLRSAFLHCVGYCSCHYCAMWGCRCCRCTACGVTVAVVAPRRGRCHHLCTMCGFTVTVVAPHVVSWL